MPMPAKAEAGPLNGTVWPILISVSVAPVSYFFCADAGAADSAIATAAPVNRCRILVLISLRSLIYDCIDDLARWSTDVIARKIVRERTRQCKIMPVPGRKTDEPTQARTESMRGCQARR